MAAGPDQGRLPPAFVNAIGCWWPGLALDVVQMRRSKGLIDGGGVADAAVSSRLGRASRKVAIGPAGCDRINKSTIWRFFPMPVRCVWCAVTALALAGAASALAGCSEGAKPAPAAVPQGGIGGAADGGQAPAAPQGMGVPKPGKAVTAATATPVPTATAPVAAATAAAAPAVKGPSVKGPPKGKVPAKLQGNSPQAEPF